MNFGTDQYAFDVDPNWRPRLPVNWDLGELPAVACDSKKRVYLRSRSDHPLIILSRNGEFVDSWGENVLTPEKSHGIYIDSSDNVYCTDLDHAVYKFDSTGELLLKLGTAHQPSSSDGVPFNEPTDAAVTHNGDILVSDGYKNHCVHRFSPDGELKYSWGEKGFRHGQFQTVHCVRTDMQERIWISDRDNLRLQIFDANGDYLDELSGLLRPNLFYIDQNNGVVYIAEMGFQVSIYTLDGRLITRWGGMRESNIPGCFIGIPHGVWVDPEGSVYVTELGVEGRIQKYIRKR